MLTGSAALAGQFGVGPVGVIVLEVLSPASVTSTQFVHPRHRHRECLARTSPCQLPAVKQFLAVPEHLEHHAALCAHFRIQPHRGTERRATAPQGVRQLAVGVDTDALAEGLGADLERPTVPGLLTAVAAVQFDGTPAVLGRDVAQIRQEVLAALDHRAAGRARPRVRRAARVRILRFQRRLGGIRRRTADQQAHTQQYGGQISQYSFFRCFPGYC